MRKFIVSDLHGNGEVYDSIISYLENISLIDKVELYINGDLIDRGIDSMRMLEDVAQYGYLIKPVTVTANNVLVDGFNANLISTIKDMSALIIPMDNVIYAGYPYGERNL